MQKMNVIAKISCYLERSVVTLILRKEYLNTMTCNTSILLGIKNWTVWYIERYSVSTYTGVTNCQNQSGFLAHPVCYHVTRSWYRRRDRDAFAAGYSEGRIIINKQRTT